MGKNKGNVNYAIQQIKTGQALLLFHHMERVNAFVAETKTGNYKENRDEDEEMSRRYLALIECPLSDYWNKQEYYGCYTNLAKLYAVNEAVDMQALKTAAGL